MAYTAPPAPTAAVPSSNGFAVASLVLGIVGSVLGLIPLLGLVALICGALAVIFGFVGVRRAQGGAPHRTMAIWGIVLGALAAVLGVVGLVIVVNAADKLDRQLHNINRRFGR